MTWGCWAPHLALALLLAVAACHPQHAPTATTPTAPKRQTNALHQGPLTDFVPAAGLRWMFVGQPKVLAQHAEFMQHVSRIIPQQRFAAFASGSGVKLTELAEGCVAGFDYGTLFLARVGHDVQAVRQAFERRLLTEPIVRSPRPEVWRIAGVVANTPESLATFDADWVAVAVGDPLLVRIVEGFALNRFKKSPSALNGAALATLPGELAQAPIRFYAPGPFNAEWSQAAGGVLARAFAVGAAITLPNAAQLHVHFVLRGTFGPGIDEAKARLERTWENLQNSPIGHLLHLESSVAPATLAVDADTATLDATYPIATLIQGLANAVVDDVNHFMVLDSAKGSPAPAD